MSYHLHSGEKRSKRWRGFDHLYYFTGIDTSQIGLATDKSKVPLLCVLEPFLAGNSILITPWVRLPSHAIRANETLGWSFWF